MASTTVTSPSAHVILGAPKMKDYLYTTGGLFALVGAAHLARTIAEWGRLAEDPWFILEGPAIGALAAALAAWAWRLSRVMKRTP
jgi:hypothetical protein